MLMGRIFSYHDTHLHRIGPNYEQLPINAPKVPVHSYNKDAAMAYHHAGGQPVYAPNSYGGPQADPQRGADLSWAVEAADLGRYAYDKHAEDDDFGQPGTMVREVLDDAARDRLVSNIAGHVKNGVEEPVLSRVFDYWRKVDGTLGDRVEEAVVGRKAAVR
jgi:catalase